MNQEKYNICQMAKMSPYEFVQNKTWINEVHWSTNLILGNHSMAKVNQQPQHTMWDGERVDRKEFVIEYQFLN
jgi:hypothetical protein